MISNLINLFCLDLVKRFPKRVQIIWVNHQKYLLRFHIKYGGVLPGVYLHNFYMGDSGRDPHNHPWKWALSFILTGGYIEERMLENTLFMYKRRVKPFSLNFIKGNTFHKVEMNPEGLPIWTLFMTFKANKTWGFWSRKDAKFVPHSEYLQDDIDVKGNYVTDYWGNKVKLIEE
jgi:hypothetical protein